MAERKTYTEAEVESMEKKVVTPKGGGFAEVRILVKDGKVYVPHVYMVPATPGDTMKWLGTLPPTGENTREDQAVGKYSQEEIYAAICYAVDLWQRQSVRESVAAESTTVSRGGREIDLMTLKPAALAALINSAAMEVSELGGKVQKAFEVARRKALELGTLAEGNPVMKEDGKTVAYRLVTVKKANGQAKVTTG
jgi:hypothetical protein